MKGYPIFQLYLESGHLHARFHIKWIKLLFYKYIFPKNELLFTCLMAQKKQPVKCDWYSEVQNIINELELNITKEDIKRITTNIFKNNVKIAAECTGFSYLRNIQVEGSKGSKI